MAHSKSVHFPDNEGLREVIEALQATLLQAIPNLVDILRPGSFSQFYNLPTYLFNPSVTFVPC